MLEDSKVAARIPVQNLQRVKPFYAEKPRSRTERGKA
jgi:hypothetical protein